jgi:tRNA threonylcarbamoyl adenosine modification protein YjeE
MANYCFDLNNIDNLAKKIFEPYIGQPSIFFINGPMGVGKTTLVNSILRHLSNATPNSSSYGIVNTYSLNPSIIHCDFFRTGWDEEIFETDVLPLLFGNFSLYMEWVQPFILSDISSSISVNLSFTTDSQREIEVFKLP